MLQPRITSITGLVRIAWIQSKFWNIICSLMVGFVPSAARRPPSIARGPLVLRTSPAHGRLQLGRAFRRGRDQLAVLRVADQVPVGLERPAVLALLLVECGAARHRPQA